MGQYQDKVAVVTGGASGIGAAIVAALLREGATVVAADLKDGEVSALPPEARARRSFLPLDISSPDDWRRLYATVRERHGRLDLLVNNAGMMQPADVETTTVEMFSRTMAVNVQGCFLGCQGAIAEMKHFGKPGAIVNIASTTALRAESWVMAYAASKAAVVSMTRTIALHLARSGLPIRCNAVLPGIVMTPMVQGLVDASPDPDAAMTDEYT